MKIKLITSGIQVSGIEWALRANPQLWNEHKDRTKDPSSPHYELDDIWARFGTAEDMTSNRPHDAKWYPSAEVLGIKKVCHDIMHGVGGVELGGVLITRIPPGKTCKPHTDPGWHARRYEKYGLQISSAPGQLFCFDNESLETKPGDLYWFDNQHRHWVTNETGYERVTMIVCIRQEK